MVAIPLTIQAATTVRRAVIPAAGFSSSLFPSTKVVTPPLFPVVDVDGVAKPAILIIIDELCKAGFDRIVVVVQESDLSHYHRLFKEPLTPQNYHRLTIEQQAQAKRIMEVGECIDLIVQKSQEGFSHAIRCAKNNLGDERFMVVLGDHIYRSFDKSGRSCVQQMIDASKTLCNDGASLLGLTISSIQDVSQFGTVAGTWINHDTNNDDTNQDNGTVVSGGGGDQFESTSKLTKGLSITHFREKPTEKEATNELQMNGMSKDSFLTIFGLYIINDPITLWNIIDDQINNNLRSHTTGNFSFTDTLNELKKKSGLKGYLLNGSRKDIGKNMILSQLHREICLSKFIEPPTPPPPFF
jgi:UTP--glucose-1-phosphate uridylyltransferase